MKSRQEIERLRTLAIKQQNLALIAKMKISKTTYGYGELLREANTAFTMAASMVIAFDMVLSEKPLTYEDERYFLTQCG